MSGSKKMPKCMGHYDAGDTICDGDKYGETDTDKMACVFRDRCSALVQHCKSNKTKPSDLVKSKKIEDDDGERRTYTFARIEDEDFGALLNRTIERWGINNGHVTKREPVEPIVRRSKPFKARGKQARPATPPSAETRRKATKALKAKALAAKLEAYKRITFFNKKLAEATGRDFAETEREAEPGDFFVVDRMGNSKYIATYCAAPGRKKIGIALVYPQMRSGLLNIHVAARPKDFSAAHKRKLDPQDEDGRFCAKIKGLDVEGATIVSEAIAALIENGAILLPPAE